MHIKVTNISDFFTFILDSLGNGEKYIKVFISDNKTHWGFDNHKYNEKIKFTFVLFSHFYQVIYTDSVKDEEYSTILKSLTEYQEQFNKPFPITRFEKIKFNEELNQLLVEKELNTF